MKRILLHLVLAGSMAMQTASAAYGQDFNASAEDAIVDVKDLEQDAEISALKAKIARIEKNLEEKEAKKSGKVRSLFKVAAYTAIAAAAIGGWECFLRSITKTKPAIFGRNSYSPPADVGIISEKTARQLSPTTWIMAGWEKLPAVTLPSSMISFIETAKHRAYGTLKNIQSRLSKTKENLENKDDRSEGSNFEDDREEEEDQ